MSEVYRRQGYSVQENPGAGADGGIDLTLFDGGTKILVQCKNWRSSKVGVSVVREMLGLVTAEKAQRGVVICSGYFTKEAQKFAFNNAIELVDGDSLARMISTIKNDPRKLNPTAISEQQSNPVKDASSTITCHSCGSPMVKRTAMKGVNVGSTFLGCSTYPKCRGTRQIS